MEPVRVFRCYNCGKALTEGRVFVEMGCGCGSRHFRPTNPRWFEYPRIYWEYYKFYRKER